MTEPREPQPEAAADPGLAVAFEVIQDLDVTGDDAGNVVGGPDAQPKNSNLEGKPVHKAWAGNRELPPPSIIPFTTPSAILTAAHPQGLARQQVMLPDDRGRAATPPIS